MCVMQDVPPSEQKALPLLPLLVDSLSCLVPEPADPGRAEEDEAPSDLPTAVMSPTLATKQDPVLAEVAQNAEKFLDAVVKVTTLPICYHSPHGHA